MELLALLLTFIGRPKGNPMVMFNVTAAISTLIIIVLWVAFWLKRKKKVKN